MTTTIQDPAIVIGILPSKQELVFRVVLLLDFDELNKACSVFHGKLSKLVQHIHPFRVRWWTCEWRRRVPGAKELCRCLGHGCSSSTTQSCAASRSVAHDLGHESIDLLIVKTEAFFSIYVAFSDSRLRLSIGKVLVTCAASLFNRQEVMYDTFGSLDIKAPLCACRTRKRAAFRLSKPAQLQRCRHKSVRTRADGNNGEQDHADKDSHQSKKKKTNTLDDFNPVKLGRRSRAALNELLAVAEKADKSKPSKSSSENGANEDPGIGAVNPIKLGRKSRAVLDDLWEQFASITSPTRSSPVTAQYSSAGEGLTEFETPQAAFTTVLVVGATGRIGRVLVRKLLLRGYKVKAMLRPRLTEDGEIDLERPAGIPQSVEIVYGDVSEYASCRAAAEGVDKVPS